MSSITDSEIFAPLDEIDSGASGGWSPAEAVFDEADDVREVADWESDTETDTEADWETDTETDTEADWETDTETDTEADWETDTETDTEADWETDTETDTEADWETDTETDTEADWEIDEAHPDFEIDAFIPDSGELDAYARPHHHHHRHHAPSRPHLPVSSSELAARIARVAEQEYRRWRPVGSRSLVETDPDATPILEDYYRTGVGMTVTAAQLQSAAWQQSHPWSAVFVSWVMKQAGAGSAFAYSAAHQNYIRAARRNRLEKNTANPFWAFRATEIAPQVGDLVCTARDHSGATYDNIADRQGRKTHCDIVTAVRPGEIRVIGGNVRQNVDAKTLRTLPDGRLRLDGRQAGYFAVIRCNATRSATLPPQPRPQPAPAPAGRVRAGIHVVQQLPLLASHAGPHPDLVLKWNDMPARSKVDVVVHLHGWASGDGTKLDLVRDKLPRSGLDFADPNNPAKVGRTTPTLMILPRGHHDPLPGKPGRYRFPALTKPGALQRLIDDSLARFTAATGVTVTRNRLILTAHSGGGQALLKILEHTTPDEVHVFDAIYEDPSALINWVRPRLGTGSSAMRVLHGAGTAKFSRQVANALGNHRLPAFRVEYTGVAHNDIPARFGWRLLADPAADMPSATLTREADNEDETDSQNDEFDSESPDQEYSEESNDETSDAAQVLTELMANQSSGELFEPEVFAADEADLGFEEFAGPEHKNIGDKGSGGIKTLLAYGEPPRALTFGDVVALAGDYLTDYAELRDLTRCPSGRMQLAYARWHCLDLKSQGVPPPTKDEKLQKRVTDRYLLLASHNLSHFNAGGTAMATYLSGHASALVEAMDAGLSGNPRSWQWALAREAFADHFLTDMFAAGHIRTPRAEIKKWYDVNMPKATNELVTYMARFIREQLSAHHQLPTLAAVVGWLQHHVLGSELLAGSIREIGGEAINAFSLGDIVSLGLHNHDNNGLDVVSVADASGRRTPGGYRWRAVGDGHLGVTGKSRAPSPEAVNTARMATAAVATSLKDLETVRRAAAKVAPRQLTTADKATLIKTSLGGTASTVLVLIPREDVSSRTNVRVYTSASGVTPMDWRWGRLGPVTYRAVNEAIRHDVADMLAGLHINDAASKHFLGLTIEVHGLQSALNGFVAHLRSDGIAVIERAVGKKAR